VFGPGQNGASIALVDHPPKQAGAEVPAIWAVTSGAGGPSEQHAARCTSGARACNAPTVTEERVQRRPVFNVARWIRSQPKEGRHLPALRAREHLDQLATSPDADALRTLARRIQEVHRQPVCAVIESMTGARLVHDTLERQG
jgi:hypothetical protein